MPAVSADRSLLEKKILGDVFTKNINDERKQMKNNKRLATEHLGRSLTVLANNGHSGFVTGLLGKHDKHDRPLDRNDWQQTKTITDELGEYLKEEKQTLNDKLRVLHNANKIFKHAEKNSDLVLRRSQRIRDLISLRTSIKRNELI